MPLVTLVPVVLLVVAGLFWFVFGLLCGWSDGPLGALLHSLLPGGLTLALALLATRWPQPVGGLVAATGVGLWCFFNRTTNPFVVGLLIAPLLGSGLTLLLGGAVRR